ncbi:MAG TPA: aquaporin [Thermoanaerobaculia bacterium]|nr:aquaporin [Thermoanaerobaculia bacterium]
MQNRLATALLAELIGTFALVFVGAGAGALALGGLLGVAFAHGFVVIGFAYAYGPISGTHINPAVTFGVWLAGKIDTGRAVAYMATQLVGGVLAGFALAGALGGTETGLGATVLTEGLVIGQAVIDVTPLQGVLIELVLTFFLVNAVLNAGVSGKVTMVAGIAIGFTLIACILMGGPLTGASLNPARTLGPALAANLWGDFWVYLVGPLAGGALAGFLYRGVFEERAG